MHHETTWITWHIHYTCKTAMVSVFSSTWKQWKELKKFSTLKSGFEKLRFQWPKTLCMCVWAGGQNTEGKKCFQKYPYAGGRGQSSSPSPTQNSWWMVVRCCLHFFRIRFTAIMSFCCIFFCLFILAPHQYCHLWPYLPTLLSDFSLVSINVMFELM